MKEAWRDKIRTITPYVAGEQPKTDHVIKLNANENPYPPSKEVEKALHNFDVDSLRLYPDSNAKELKDTLADFYHVTPKEIFVGNGSDEVLALSFLAFFHSKKAICFPDITYSFYPVWCDLFQIPYQTMPLTQDFRICPRDYDVPNGGVILPNPNAPTSIGEGKEFIEDILKNNQDVIVIIDEAYADFSGYSCIELIKQYSNLVVVHTFSKSRSLPGMRLGTAIANPELIQILEAVKNSYNSYTVNSLTMAAGIASIKDNAYFEDTIQRIVTTRDEVSKQLRELGFEVLKSDTNFLFCTHKEYSAAELFEYLRSRNIFIRYFNLPRINQYLRITIGTEEQMDTMIAVVKEYLKSKETKGLCP